MLYLPSCQDLHLFGRINKAIRGDGLYLHKHDKCYRVQNDGLYLAPHPRFVEGDGLFLKHGNDNSDSAGLLMGKNSSVCDGYCNCIFRRDV